MKTTTLLATTLISLLMAGQTAMAGQDVERDEYSIAVVWTDNAPSANTNRVSYSLQSVDDVASGFSAEGGERDEYSIGLVWSDTAATASSRVNYSAPEISAEDLALDAELFPNNNR